MRPAGAIDFLAVDAALAHCRDRIGPEFVNWQASFWARFGQDPPLAYVHGDDAAIVEGSPGHRVVIHCPGALIPDLVASLRADARVAAISLPEATDLPGFRLTERWEHHYDLAFAPEQAGPGPAGYVVRPWLDERSDEAAELLAATNGATLDGLYLVWPDLPSRESCERLLADLRAGSRGPFSPDVSFLAFHGDRLAGLTLVSRPSPEDAFLYEIAVRFRHRGTGLAVHLLDRIKAVLRPSGCRHIHFLTCGSNAAVLALFRPGEVRSALMGTSWVWLRD